MLFSQAPISSHPISSVLQSAFTASIALTQPASSIAISESEVETDGIALTQPASAIAIAGVFFAGSIALTQGASSISIKSFNGLAPWAPAQVVNTPIRKVKPALAQTRQAVPSLTKTRQNEPTLVE